MPGWHEERTADGAVRISPAARSHTPLSSAHALHHGRYEPSPSTALTHSRPAPPAAHGATNRRHGALLSTHTGTLSTRMGYSQYSPPAAHGATNRRRRATVVHRVLRRSVKADCVATKCNGCNRRCNKVQRVQPTLQQSATDATDRDGQAMPRGPRIRIGSRGVLFSTHTGTLSTRMGYSKCSQWALTWAGDAARAAHPHRRASRQARHVAARHAQAHAHDDLPRSLRRGAARYR
jgi:hypothetical protein